MDSSSQSPVFGQVVVKSIMASFMCTCRIDGDGPDLMGRDWIKALGFTLKLGEIHFIEECKSLHVVEKQSTLKRKWGVLREQK